MVGRRYGRLIVQEKTERINREDTWTCRCDCGNITTATTSALVTGHKKSCGCYKLERISQSHKTHGESEDPLYHKWEGIKQRCHNPSTKDYPRYGGRGIEVCQEWRDSFEAFRDWALANGYRDDLTIERKDTDGDYCPENCCWATQREQANNRRNNRIVEYKGERKTVAEWAECTGIGYETLRQRLNNGWDVERAMTTPQRGYKKHERHQICE